jgi:hypothetical protein
MPVIKVQRYFFGLRWSDHEDDDANGTLLSDDAAALNYADRCQWALKFPRLWASNFPWLTGLIWSVISRFRDLRFASLVVVRSVLQLAAG